MVRDGVRFFFLPHVREQLAREILAQFEAFAKTGLVLDHVNTHKHFHLHPTVLGLILEIGREFGMKAMRLPFEANAPLWLRPWIAQVRARLDRAGICHNDYVIGIARSGRMDEAAWHARLPARGRIRGAAFAGCVARAIRHLGVRVGGFSDVFGDVFVD
ncbi:MAG: cellobiose phosphotransferase system celC [uncultured Paraburkholderia sp.]|nr:MAG: cellobiose phosphotransferase system celC [uncultured Paraburkholderia sp.]